MATTHPGPNIFVGSIKARTAITGPWAETMNIHINSPQPGKLLHNKNLNRIANEEIAGAASEIRLAMTTIPSGLPELYNQMLLHITNKHRSFVQEIAFLLHCVILVKRPLTLKALCALVIPDVAYHTEISEGESWIRGLVVMSGEFLELQSAGDESSDVFVALVHQSARDYLVTRLDPESKEFCIVEGDMHLKIAQRCLTCLENNWIQAGKPHPEAQKKPVHPDQADLAQYALEFWHYHARQCGVYAHLLFDPNRPFFWC